MHPYRLEKWYFDLPFGEGGLLFGYLARLELGPFRVGTAHLSLVGSPEGLTNFSRSQTAVLTAGWPGGLRVGGSSADLGRAASIQLATGDLSLELTTEPLHPLLATPSPLEATPGLPPLLRYGSQGIYWRPLTLGQACSGSLRLAGRRIPIEGAPLYLDQVVSLVYPWRVDCDCLCWGRWRSDGLAATWSATLERPTPEDTLAPCRGELQLWTPTEARRLAVTHFAVAAPGEEPAYLLRANAGRTEVELTVSHSRVAREQDFVGEALGRTERWLPWVRPLVRSPRASKAFAKCELKLTEGATVTTTLGEEAFSELVSFG